MKLIVVSDLHIQNADEPIYLSLLKLLKEAVKPGDIFVFAGDVFDLFVGNKSYFKKNF